jgi:pullulanase/glycogen debranching enzyme
VGGGTKKAHPRPAGRVDAVLPGRLYPLGATWDGEGVNFALFSEHAERVELCLFESPDDRHEARRIMLAECTHNIWHAHNHTAEGNQLGPTLSFRGVDNYSYHRLAEKDPRHYRDYTGCGNTLDMTTPSVLQLIMDSLRYWILEMHVDGFRFDLAAALAREFHEVDRLGAFFDIIHQDPTISQVKLIAEPWDLGEGGYQVGHFPVGWTEWNGKYRDGHNENLSWNCGAEGPTEDPAINALRERQQRNFLAVLVFSQGVPMISGGDEIGRTQKGNNNAYCQDNEVSWYDWKLDATQRALLEFTSRLIAIRRRHPSLRRHKFFQGRPIRGGEVKDLVWLRPDGKEMTDEEWSAGWQRTLGMRLDGDALDVLDKSGRRIKDDTFLLLLNAHHEPVPFTLPAFVSDARWTVVVDTNRPDLQPDQENVAGHEVVTLGPRSLLMLKLQP